MKPLYALLVLLLVGCGCQSERGFPPEHQIRNFDRVTPEVWRGAQPNQEGFRWLSEQKCKVIINLRELSDSLPNEQELVHRSPSPWTNGMAYYSFPLSGTHAPTRKQVDDVLSIIDHEIADGHFPVFVHCRWGCDRTSVIIACWRIRHGWSNADALREAEVYGLSPWEFGMRSFIKHYTK